MDMKNLILSEGINGWASAGKEYEVYMDGFVEQAWKK
jgi:hypothetical protein